MEIENLESILANLNEQERTIVKYYYGLNNFTKLKVSDLSKKIGISKYKIDKIIIKSNSLIVSKILSDINIDNKKNIKLALLMEKYGQENVLNAIQQLGNRTKQVLVLHYGLNGHQAIPYTEMCSILGVQVNITAALRRLEKFLITDKEYEEENQKLFNHITSTYDQGKILTYLNNLKEDKKLIMEYFLKNKTTKNKTLKIKIQVNDILNSLEKELSRPQGIYHSRFQELINSYGQENVINAVTKLNENSKKVIILYFGLDGSNPMNNSQINSVLGIEDSNKWIHYGVDRLKNILEDMKKKEEHLKSKVLINDLANKKRIPSRSTQLFQLEYLPLVLRNKTKELISQYGEKEVFISINELKPVYKKVVKLRLGYDGTTPKTNAEIEKILNIENGSSLLNEGMYQLSRILEVGKRREFFSLINEYKEESIDEVLSLLPHVQSKALTLRYGYKNNVPISTSEVNDILQINNATQLIQKAEQKLKELLPRSNKEKYYELVEEYGQEKVIKAINDCKIKNKTKSILNDFLSIHNDLSYKEIEEKYGCKTAYTIIADALKKITIQLNTTNKKIISH